MHSSLLSVAYYLQIPAFKINSQIHQIKQFTELKFHYGYGKNTSCIYRLKKIKIKKNKKMGSPRVAAMADVCTPFPRRPRPSRVRTGHPYPPSVALMLDFPHALPRRLSEVRRDIRRWGCFKDCFSVCSGVLLTYSCRDRYCFLTLIFT